jgi:hypothetical protein
MFKAFADVRIMPKLSADINLVSTSGVIARGNENNAHQPDGTYYLGPGSTPAYGIMNIGVRYDLTAWLQLIAQFNNIFDKHYDTAAQLQSTGFTSTGNFIPGHFPRSAASSPCAGDVLRSRCPCDVLGRYSGPVLTSRLTGDQPQPRLPETPLRDFTAGLVGGIKGVRGAPRPFANFRGCIRHVRIGHVLSLCVIATVGVEWGLWIG